MKKNFKHTSRRSFESYKDKNETGKRQKKLNKVPYTEIGEVSHKASI